MSRKLINFSIEECNKLVESLTSHDNKFNIPMSSEVKKFIKEIQKELKPKNLTQSRATIISVDISTFYYQNRIVMEIDIQEFLDKIEHNIEDGIARSFYNAANETARVLNRCPKRRFLDADLYFCNENIYTTVLSIKKEYEDLLTTTYEKRHIGYNKILNILNNKKVVIDYSVSYIPRSKAISKARSVEKYINSEFAVWKHNITRETEEFITTHLTKKIDIKKKRAELHREILKAQDTYDDLVRILSEQIKNKSKKGTKIRIISYPRANLHPKISLSTGTTKVSKHLMSTCPNLLWFRPQVSRTDMDVDEFIKHAKNPFGDVYYIENYDFEED